MADLNGPRPSIIRHYLRDCAWCCLAEAEATAVPEKNNLAITYRPGPGVLRGDHALGGPSGPRAIRHLRRSPLAIDLYVWLTYRMSYLQQPTLVPWQGLQNQVGADYARPRDFRRRVLTQLQEVLRQYPTVRVSQTDTGLRLYPSPPHVQARH